MSPRSQTVRGIGSMLIAVGLFSGMDTFLKLIAGHYPTMQVSAMRGAASLPFVVLPLLVQGRLRELRPVNWRLHLFRGLLAVAMLGTFVYAVRTLPLADAYSIFLAAPLLVSALSGPLLKERVDARRWLAIGVGMAGVLVLLRPGAGGMAILGLLAALGSAICYALGAISIRVLTRTDGTPAMVFWFMLLLTALGGALALPGWVPLRGEHWPWLIAVGILGALAQHFMTDAFRSAPAAAIAPFEYTALLWAMAIDWLVWAHPPSKWMLAGAAIIIASGLYLIRAEHRAAAVPAAG